MGRIAGKLWLRTPMLAGARPGRVFVLAFAIAIAYGILVPPQPLHVDSMEYHAIARNLVGGEGFGKEPGRPTASWPPLYPFFLALLYLAFGPSHPPVWIAQALLHGVTAAGACEIGRRAFGDRAGAFAGVAVALTPPLVVFTGFHLSETLFTALLLLGILALLVAWERDSSTLAMIAGSLTGMAVLCRPVAIGYPVALGLLAIATARRRRIFFIAALTGLTLVGSWTLRNWFIFRAVVPVATGGGIAMWAGSYPAWGGEWRAWNDEPLRSLPYRELDPIAADRFFYREAWENIKRQPVAFLSLAWRKIVLLWGRPYSHTPFIHHPHLTRTDLVIRGIFYLFHYALLFFGVLGLILALRDRRMPGLLIASVPLYVTALHLLTFAEARYNIPALPFLAILAASALARNGGTDRKATYGEAPCRRGADSKAC